MAAHAAWDILLPLAEMNAMNRFICSAAARKFYGSRFSSASRRKQQAECIRVVGSDEVGVLQPSPVIDTYDPRTVGVVDGQFDGRVRVVVSRDNGVSQS